MSIIDISVILDASTHKWPGSAGLRREWVRRISEGDATNDSIICCDSHIGTHVDAPLHFIESGTSCETMALDILCGKAFVADLGDVRCVGEKELREKIPEGVKRVLLKTGNSALWKESGFNAGFAALTEGGAKQLVKTGVRLVGIDYLSVGPYPDGAVVHRTLLGDGIVIAEGLNLGSVTTGWYYLVCLPLKIAGAEGAPARAVLMPLEEKP